MLMPVEEAASACRLAYVGARTRQRYAAGLTRHHVVDHLAATRLPPRKPPPGPVAALVEDVHDRAVRQLGEQLPDLGIDSSTPRAARASGRPRRSALPDHAHRDPVEAAYGWSTRHVIARLDPRPVGPTEPGRGPSRVLEDA